MVSIALCFLVLHLTYCACWIPIPDTRHNIIDDPLYSSVDPGKALILTPYIKSKNPAIRNLCEVQHSDFKGVRSFSGFITVNETFNSNLFFWFFLSEDDYQKDPLLIWLQGGPGGSSLFGLFEENGPFILDNGQIKHRNTSWTRQHSVIYIDNPVGTGFSFANDTRGYATEQTQVGKELYEFLQQFFEIFPELKKNDLFISGESYAGKYIPALAHTVLRQNPTAKNFINLKGLAIGNGFSDPYHQAEYADFVYHLGLIDSKTRAKLHVYEDEVKQLISLKKWTDAARKLRMTLVYLSIVSDVPSMYNYLIDIDVVHTKDRNISKYVQRNDVRFALHVGTKAHDSSNVYMYLADDIPRTVAPWISELLEHYKVMIFTGQLDILVGYSSTRNYLDNLRFKGDIEYKNAERQTWLMGPRLAGYVKTGGNLTDVLVRNSGHMVPADQPEACYNLIYKFTRNIPL